MQLLTKFNLDNTLTLELLFVYKTNYLTQSTEQTKEHENIR